ncbi:LCP family protein [Marinicrinis sediminis]|uniref:LCP family protein n=1 Tax=Marinicrinis sediminis TaxID=1652465 RepID=A0ABW5RBX0_9BACL
MTRLQSWYRPKRWFWITACLFVFLAAAVITKLYISLGNTHLDTSNPLVEETVAAQFFTPSPPADGADTDQTAKAEDFYALLIGIDARDQHVSLNTDTLLAAHVIPQTGQIKLVSLPRDLRIDAPFPDVKINAVFAKGYSQARLLASENPALESDKLKSDKLESDKKISFGDRQFPEAYLRSGMVLTREAVEHVLETEIDYTFLVHFQTLVSLVDEVGGVEINVDRTMQYDADFDDTHIHLEPGLQLLDGRNALNYARFRLDDRGPAYDSNDFERAARQKQVVTALIEKLHSWNSLPKMFDLMDVVTRNLKTDMTNRTMLAMVTKYYGQFSGAAVVHLPFNGYWEYPNVVIPDDELAELRANFVSTDEVETPQQMALQEDGVSAFP